MSTRVMLVNLLGGSARDPHPDIFGKGKGIDESLAYPSLKRSMADWEAVAPLLTEALKKVDDKVLAAKAPFPTPMGEKLGEVIASRITKRIISGRWGYSGSTSAKRP